MNQADQLNPGLTIDLIAYLRQSGWNLDVIEHVTLPIYFDLERAEWTATEFRLQISEIESIRSQGLPNYLRTIQEVWRQSSDPERKYRLAMNMLAMVPSAELRLGQFDQELMRVTMATAREALRAGETHPLFERVLSDRELLAKDFDTNLQVRESLFALLGDLSPTFPSRAYNDFLELIRWRISSLLSRSPPSLREGIRRPFFEKIRDENFYAPIRFSFIEMFVFMNRSNRRSSEQPFLSEQENATLVQALRDLSTNREHLISLNLAERTIQHIRWQSTFYLHELVPQEVAPTALLFEIMRQTTWFGYVDRARALLENSTDSFTPEQLELLVRQYKANSNNRLRDDLARLMTQRFERSRDEADSLGLIMSRHHLEGESWFEPLQYRLRVQRLQEIPQPATEQPRPRRRWFLTF